MQKCISQKDSDKSIFDFFRESFDIIIIPSLYIGIRDSHDWHSLVHFHLAEKYPVHPLSKFWNNSGLGYSILGIDNSRIAISELFRLIGNRSISIDLFRILPMWSLGGVIVLILE
jgi:hypothetical protein